ncbi:hypothetical protein ABZ876_35645 [Streptomyces sp. NPDC046931]|uniref:hypothetical protein n=1 Tax=Streptomyces sp. NPDC046931 TaxID=3154806 RepID=UPI0033C4404A
MLLALVACARLCGVRSVGGVLRWDRGQSAGILAALEGHPREHGEQQQAFDADYTAAGPSQARGAGRQQRAGAAKHGTSTRRGTSGLFKQPA